MIRIKVSGNNPEYFLKKIIGKRIRYNNLNIFYKELIFDVDYFNYKKLLDVKTSYDINIIGYLGLYKYVYFIINYYYIFVFFLVGLLNIIFLSNMIFDVEVIHSNSSIRELVYSKLNYYGIKKFRFKISYFDKEKIIDNILRDEIDNLEWLEIEDVGSKYIVKVQEKKKNNIDDDCNSRHIVAKKDAMITSIFASSGEVIKKKYDYVKKGEVLISGLIYNKEDIVNSKCAVGKVLGEVWYKVNVFLPEVYYEEKITNNKKNGIEFVFFNNTFSLFNNFSTYIVNRKNIICSNLLPVGLYYSTYLETIVLNKKYDINNIDDEAFDLAISKLYNRLGNDISIKSRKVLKKEKKKSKILVEVFIKVEEDITDFYDIDNLNNSNKE